MGDGAPGPGPKKDPSAFGPGCVAISASLWEKHTNVSMTLILENKNDGLFIYLGTRDKVEKQGPTWHSKILPRRLFLMVLSPPHSFPYGGQCLWKVILWNVSIRGLKWADNTSLLSILSPHHQRDLPTYWYQRWNLRVLDLSISLYSTSQSTTHRQASKKALAPHPSSFPLKQTPGSHSYQEIDVHYLPHDQRFYYSKPMQLKGTKGPKVPRLVKNPFEKGNVRKAKRKLSDEIKRYRCVTGVGRVWWERVELGGRYWPIWSTLVMMMSVGVLPHSSQTPQCSDLGSAPL